MRRRGSIESVGGHAIRDAPVRFDARRPALPSRDLDYRISPSDAGPLLSVTATRNDRASRPRGASNARRRSARFDKTEIGLQSRPGTTPGRLYGYRAYTSGRPVPCLKLRLSTWEAQADFTCG